MRALEGLAVSLLALLSILQTNCLEIMTLPPAYAPLEANLFASDIFSAISNGQSSKNLIYSPMSIQTSLAMAYIGAEGQTAEDMRNVLKLGYGSKDDIAERYSRFLKTALDVEKFHATQLKMANRIYVNEFYRLKPKYNEKVERCFNAKAESINFLLKTSANEINQWVEQQTENRIKNLIKAENLNSKTTTVLVNALYFKGEWEYPFSESRTQDAEFQVNKQEKRSIRMMHNTAHFRYADLPEFGAAALEMPFNNSDISMLFILPHEVEGLAKLEDKLRGKDFNDICSKMSLTKTCVSLPKFRLEYEIDLKDTLTKLGLPIIFSNKANFQGIFDSPEPQSISYVKHKAFLDINEAGSEATAATFETLECRNLNDNIPTFNANHPFIFAIRNKEAVYFTGHVYDI